MEKEKWLKECRRALESLASVEKIRGTDSNLIVNGMVGGAHVRNMHNDPVTAVLRNTEAWTRILEMPERLKTGDGRSTRYYWPKDNVIEICLEELSALYDREHRIPTFEAGDEFNGSYLKKDHTKLRLMNASFPKELVEDFDKACKKLGISGRTLVEPVLFDIIQKARDAGFSYEDARPKEVKKNVDTSLKSMSFMIDEDLVNEFDLACKKLGVSRRKVIEPEVLKVIEKANERKNAINT